MAAPAVVTRTAPADPRLTNGFVSKMAFSQDPDISIYEITVEPPEIDGGDAINIATQWDPDWIPMAPRARKTLTGKSITCAYSSKAYMQLCNIVNEEGTFTQLWPDGANLSFYAYVRQVTFEGLEDGKFPTMTVNYTCTNYDPVNKVTAGPVYTPAGT